MSIQENGSVTSGRRVSFKNEAEIRNRTASEDSSTSTIQRKRKTNSKKIKDIESGFKNVLNFRSYANGSSHLSKYNKKSATENKFDMLLNGKCSWSYKSMKAVSYKKEDNEVKIHSFLQVQSSETSARLSEDNITTNNRETFTVRESKSLKNSMESSCLKPNTFNAVKSLEIDRDYSYDYDENDRSTTRKNVNRRNKNIRNKRMSSPLPPRTLRKKKRISYAGLDTDSYLNSDKNYTSSSSVAGSEKDYARETGEKNGIKRELYENNDSDYSDEGLVLQTGFSDKSANLLNIASSIESDSINNFESLEESDKCGKRTTPLILRLENENKLSNKQTGSLTSDINQKAYIEERSQVNEVILVENPHMQPSNNKSGSEISSLNPINAEANNENLSETNYGQNKILDLTNKSIEMSQSDNSIDLEADISERYFKLSSEMPTKCSKLELPAQSDDELSNNFNLNKYKSSKSLIYQQPEVKAQVTKTIRENTSEIENTINDDLTENILSKQNSQTKNLIKARKGSKETYPKINKSNKFLEEKSSTQTTEIYTIATSKENVDKGNINKTDVTGKSKLDKLSSSQTNLVQANFSRNKSRVATSIDCRNKDEMSLDSSFELNQKTMFEDLSSSNESKNDTTSNLSWKEILKTQAESFNEMFASPVKQVKKTFQRKKFPKKVPNCNNDSEWNITLPLKSKLHSFHYNGKDTTCNILNSDVENYPLEIDLLKNNVTCEDDLLDLDPKENLQFENDWDNTVYSFDQRRPFSGNKNLGYKSKENQINKITKGRQEKKSVKTSSFCYKDTDTGTISTSTKTTQQNLKTSKDTKQKNESTSKKKPKTWEDLESKLLSETYDLPEKFNHDGPLVPFEIYSNNIRLEKGAKRSNDSWKKRNFDIEGINDQLLAKGIDNNTYKSPEYSQILVNSPNLNIINKTIAAMEKCTSVYLSPHKDFQDGWTKYSDKHDASNTQYNVSVQSTIIQTTGKKLSITEATNNYFKSTSKPVKVINKEDQQHLDSYRFTDDAHTSSEDILHLRHQILKAKSNNTTGKKVKLENSAQAPNTSKRSNNTKVNKKNAKNAQQSILNTSSNLNLNTSISKYSENEETATFDILMPPSDEEICNSSDKNSCLERNIDKHYGFRKCKRNTDSQNNGKKFKSSKIKVDAQVRHSYRVSNYEDKSCGKNKLTSVMKNPQSLKNDLVTLKSKSGQRSKSKATDIDTVGQTNGETSNDTNSDKICDEINLCNSSIIDFTNYETESSPMEMFESIPIIENLNISSKRNENQNKGDNLGRIPLNGNALQKNERYRETKDTNSLEIYKDSQYLNNRPSNHLHAKLNNKKTKEDQIEKQQDTAKDKYIKYLKELFQSEHSFSENTQEKDNEDEEIVENILCRSDGTKLILKDDDLFSISTEDSDKDENNCTSQVSQTLCCGLFSDVLDEDNI